MQSSEQKCLFIWQAILISYLDGIIESAKFRNKVQNKNVDLFRQAILISYMDDIINNLINREYKVQNKNVDLFLQAIDFIHGWHY